MQQRQAPSARNQGTAARNFAKVPEPVALREFFALSDVNFRRKFAPTC
jgi:hypothetical protein